MIELYTNVDINERINIPCHLKKKKLHFAKPSLKKFFQSWPAQGRHLLSAYRLGIRKIHIFKHFTSCHKMLMDFSCVNST